MIGRLLFFCFELPCQEDNSNARHKQDHKANPSACFSGPIGDRSSGDVAKSMEHHRNENAPAGPQVQPGVEDSQHNCLQDELPNWDGELGGAGDEVQGEVPNTPDQTQDKAGR